MVDFTLSVKEKYWRDLAKKFTQEHIMGRSDLDIAGKYPLDIYQAAFEAGLVTSMIPKEYGGGGASVMEMIMAGEEVAYGDLGVATTTFLHKLASWPLIQFGSDEQKEKWLMPLSKKLTFGSLAFTEPLGSSNLAGRAATTTATKVDGGYLINGVKSTISNATLSSQFTVFARVEDGPAHLTCFMVSKLSKGVSTLNPYIKMGQRAADTGEVHFKDVFVADEDMIGRVGQGTQIAINALKGSRVGIGAMGVGVSCRARDLAKIYGHERTAGDGKPLIEKQDYSFRIAKMEAQIEMMRALVWRSAWEVDNGPFSTKFSSITKMECANLANEIVAMALEMTGAQGYLQQGLLEKLVRDAKALQIYEGTEAVQKMMIADTAIRLGSLKK